jgi:helix-turn-helix protein
MSALAVHELLSQTRHRRKEELASVARNIGVRKELLQAMEDGRFADLPRGIYARASIRAYSAALNLEPDEILAACDHLLPAAEDPITGIARLRGVRSGSERAVRKRTADLPSGCPSWRFTAAATIDALTITAMLLPVIASTVAASGVAVSALGGMAAAAFVVIGVVLASCYFVLLGGIVGGTVGERMVGLGRTPPHRVDLRTVAAGALRCATHDVAFITQLGRWLGGLGATHQARLTAFVMRRRTPDATGAGVRLKPDATGPGSG